MQRPSHLLKNDISTFYLKVRSTLYNINYITTIVINWECFNKYIFIFMHSKKYQEMIRSALNAGGRLIYLKM